MSTVNKGLDLEDGNWLTREEVARRYGKTGRWVQQQVAAKKYPKPKRFSHKTVRWELAKVLAYEANC